MYTTFEFLYRFLGIFKGSEGNEFISVFLLLSNITLRAKH